MSAQVANLLPVLQNAVQAEDIDLVLSICDQVLKLTPDDEDVIDCKVVALLQIEKYEDAIAEIGQLDSAGFNLHKAYALYKLKQDDKLFAHLDAVDAKQADENLAHLRAQALYRCRRAPEALEVYTGMQAAESSDQELLSNLVAACVAAGDCSSIASLLQQSNSNSDEPDRFEYEYNKACALLSLDKLNDASALFKQSIANCETTLLEDGCEEDEIQEEQASAKVNLAYVAQLSGDPETARTLYAEVQGYKVGDATVNAVTSNNMLALKEKKGEKLFDSLHRSEKAVGLPAKKTTASQEQVYMSNRVLLLLLAKQHAKAAAILADKSDMLGSPSEVAILRATMEYNAKNVDKCKAILTEFMASNPADAGAVQLTLAHLCLLDEDVKGAINVLVDAKELQHRPAWVATLVALYERVGDENAASGLLDAALQYWEKNDTTHKSFARLAERSAEYKMQSGHYAEAVKLYKHVVNETKKSDDADTYQHMVAKLIVALVRSGASDSEIAPFSKQLADIDEIPDLGVENLEDLTLPSLQRRRQEKDEKGQSNNTQMEVKKNRRKRKPRYPKNFDPANPGPKPDPQRWLPKWQRTRTKSGKKIKRKPGEFKGAQGGLPPGHELNHGNGEVKEEKKNPPQKQNPPGNKKKKKKGKKK